MATIVTRSGKGSPLTNTEVDSNFTNLNTDKLELSGGTLTGDLTFGDSDKAIFGAGSDLQIYHDGSDSYITDTGTGSLIIRASDTIRLQTHTGELYFQGVKDGTVKLYYDNAETLITTSTGIDVTGTVTSDGLNVAGAGTVSGSVAVNTAGSGDGGILVGPTGYSGSFVYKSSGDVEIAPRSGKNLIFANSTGGTERIRITSAGNVGIGTVSPDSLVHAYKASNAIIKVAEANGYASLQQSGVNSYLNNVSSGGSLIFRNGTSPTERMRIDSSGEVHVGHTGNTAPWTMSGSQKGIGLYGSSGFIGVARANAEPLLLNRTSSDGGIINFRKDGTTVGSIRSGGNAIQIGTTNTGLYFADNIDSIAPYDISGGSVRDNAIDLGYSGGRFKDAYLSGGVYLGGTGAANKLSDVETGTFTPIWNGYTPYGTSGKYVKIGTQVTVYATLITNAATDGSLIKLNNLPFQIAGDQGGGMVYHNSVGLYAYNIYTLFTANTTICELKTVSGGAEVGVAYVSSNPAMGGYSTLRWTIVYTTAS
jgi:hypothetical protein